MMPPRSPDFRKDSIHSAVGVPLSGMLQTNSPRFCLAGTGPERRRIDSIIRPSIENYILAIFHTIWGCCRRRKDLDGRQLRVEKALECRRAVREGALRVRRGHPLPDHPRLE